MCHCSREIHSKQLLTLMMYAVHGSTALQAPIMAHCQQHAMSVRMMSVSQTDVKKQQPWVHCPACTHQYVIVDELVNVVCITAIIHGILEGC